MAYRGRDAESRRTLERDLSKALNRHSSEGPSGTPDCVLAAYLVDCLESYERAVQRREAWHGRRADDSLDEVVAEEAVKDPKFTKLVARAAKRRRRRRG